MGDVGNEDKTGWINLNVRVHRDDLFEAIGLESDEISLAKGKRLLSKKKFKEIVQRMKDKEPFSGGDVWQEACRDAYHAVMG